MDNEEKIQAVNSNLAEMENGSAAEELWLINLIREKLAGANSQVLDFFLEITNQEKARLTDWFRAPDESEEILLGITKLAGALREYGVNLKNLSLPADGRDCRVSELVERPDTLDEPTLRKLHALLSGEIKKMEITGQVKMLESMVDWGKEEEKPGPEGGAAPPAAPEEADDTERRLAELWSRKVKPDYLRIEVYNPTTFLDKVPRLLSRDLLESFTLTPQEQDTISLVDGRKNFKKIVEMSPIKFDAINLFIFLKRRKVMEW